MTKKQNIDSGFEQVLEGYINRRGFLKTAGLLGSGAIASACTPARKHDNTSLSFTELAHDLDRDHAVADGYESQVLLRWGDPLFADAEDFDPLDQSEAKQLRQFGYNNDFVGFVSLPLNSGSSDHGLLVVNHEYTITELMFPDAPIGTALSLEQVKVDIAAHGLSVVEIKRRGQHWSVVRNSVYNRRITPNTPMAITGPAAGSERMKTALTKDGVSALGTIGNCAGGVTPWGTILTGEENVDGYFSGDVKRSPERVSLERFGKWAARKNWSRFFDRWDLNKSPNMPLHYGWVVEIDPYDPESTPKKRTALGRFKHEGCNVFVGKDGRVCAYTGDDQHFEYIYKFVSNGRYSATDRSANMRLLDEGTLYVAKFYDTGDLEWLPMIFGQGPLTPSNGFENQADVMIDARRAGDLLGATPMDRPEDIEVNPVNGRVYAMLTNNSQRLADQVDKANPKAHNAHGQILEFWPEDADHSQTTFRWDLFLVAGNPAKTFTYYHTDVSRDGWLSCPDNCAFDHLGNLWVATDGAPKTDNVADGLWATEVSGPYRALTKRFMRTPKGAEMCGPFFTPDSENLFCSIQHPASGSSYHQPSTRWPDFSSTLPPRPAILVTRKIGGGRVGS